MAGSEVELDSIGPWSEIKLEIVQQYAEAYSKILAKQPGFHHVYIDAFAGAGDHVSRRTGAIVEGSPRRALDIEPPFKQYHFIDIKLRKVEYLGKIAGERTDVHLYHGDCNEVLLEKVFPTIEYVKRMRALCLVDPYGLHLDWKVLADAAKRRAIEIFLNFPIMDMQRNVLIQDLSKVDPVQAKRLTRFWGDESWRTAAYGKQKDLFGYQHKNEPEDLASAFRERLREIAGFRFVPEPIPMRSTTGSTLYYLFFASHNATGARIASYILKKHKK